VAVLHELPPRIMRHLASMTAPSPQSVTLHIAGGVTIVWGGTDRPGEKSRELSILMRTRALFYDVSAPGTAVTG
jgi:cell division protein FtsQ